MIDQVTWPKLLVSDALVNAGQHFLVQVAVVVDAAQVPDEVLRFHALQSRERKLRKEVEIIMGV